MARGPARVHRPAEPGRPARGPGLVLRPGHLLPAPTAVAARLWVPGLRRQGFSLAGSAASALCATTCLSVVALVLMSPATCLAAAYAPGTDTRVEPLDAPAAPAPAGNGIRWMAAPVRLNGSVALDLRWLRMEDGSRTSQALVYNDIDAATYIWQPWFALLRGGVGVLAERSVFSASGGAGDTIARTGSLTGRVALTVFPASRFPFEIRADVSDSRVSGDNLGADYRSQRLGITQSWRPVSGADSVLLNFEHSRLMSDTGTDSANYMQATATHLVGDQSFDFTASATRNQRDDALLGTNTSAHTSSTLAAIGLRHAYRPDTSVNLDTLASWNSLRFSRDDTSSDPELRTDLRQIASYGTWRPGATGSLFGPAAPLMLSASLRWADSSASSGDVSAFSGSTTQRLRSMFGSVGATQEIGRSWRLAGAVAAGLVQPEGGVGRLSRDANVSLGYVPPSVLLGDWRYSSSASVSAGFGDVRRRDQTAPSASTPSAPATDNANAEPGERRTVGTQLEHGASRSLVLGEGNGSLSFSVSQSLGALHVSTAAENARALAHGASVYWQGGSDGGAGSRQSYAGLSVSDSRSWAPDKARFQLVNLQYSQRAQLARHASWSGDLTLQASRADVSQIDAFSGDMRMASQGWQRYTNGSLSYEDQRFLEVPRLRYTVTLSVHSQQFERRSLGDIDAPRERITQSLENRLDYLVGKLETRLAARWARVDERYVTALQARVLRRY